MEDLVKADDLVRLGILAKGTAYKMAKAGAIPCYHVGVGRRGVRFKASEVLASLRGGEPLEVPTSIRDQVITGERPIAEPIHTNEGNKKKPRSMKNIVIKEGGAIYVRLWAETKTVEFGAFGSLEDAKAFRDKCQSEMRRARFFPEQYRKVGTIGGIPVIALRSHWVSQRKEFLEWQRMKLELARVKWQISQLAKKS